MPPVAFLIRDRRAGEGPLTKRPGPRPPASAGRPPPHPPATPAPKWNLLDRYLAVAGALRLPALIVITKADLAPGDDDLAEALDDYRRLGYPVAVTSALAGASSHTGACGTGACGTGLDHL